MRKVIDPEEDLKLNEELNEIFCNAGELIYSYRRRENSSGLASNSILMISGNNKEAYHSKFGLKIENKHEFGKSLPTQWSALNAKCLLLDIILTSRNDPKKSILVEKWCFSFEVDAQCGAKDEIGFYKVVESDDRTKKFSILIRSLSCMLIALPMHRTLIKYWLDKNKKVLPPNYCDSFDISIKTYKSTYPHLISDQLNWNSESLKSLQNFKIPTIKLMSHSFNFMVTYVADLSWIIKQNESLAPPVQNLPTNSMKEESPQPGIVQEGGTSLKGLTDKFRNRPRIVSEDYTKVQAGGRLANKTSTLDSGNSPFCLTPHQGQESSSIYSPVESVLSFSPPFETHLVCSDKELHVKSQIEESRVVKQGGVLNKENDEDDIEFQVFDDKGIRLEGKKILTQISAKKNDEKEIEFSYENSPFAGDHQPLDKLEDMDEEDQAIYVKDQFSALGKKLKACDESKFDNQKIRDLFKDLASFNSALQSMDSKKLPSK